MNIKQILANGWWGKILGGFFGFLIGGSVLALFGILIGNFLDKELSAFLSKLHRPYHDEKHSHVQKIFLKTTFTIMGYLAKSDGRVSEDEINMAQQVIVEMKLNNEQKKIAKYYFNQGKQGAFQRHDILIQLQQACYGNTALLKVFIDIQYRMAQVDGLSLTKTQELNNILQQLGFAPLHHQHRFYEDFAKAGSSWSRHNKNQGSSQQPSQNTLAQAYALLNISPNASKKEVKHAYRRAISQNHPDKLIAQGLPEAKIKIANEKTQQITKAYEQIRISKNWN